MSVTTASLPARYAMLTESWKEWNNVEMGVKIRVTSPSKFNAAGKAYMKRGEWINFSVRMLGFEVATLWIDRDSIVAVDKYHKKYFSEPTDKLLGGAGITIENVQDMLLGRAFLAGKGTARPTDMKQFDFEDERNGWFLLPRQQPSSYKYGFLASSTYNGLRGAVCEIDNFGSVTVDYSNICESRLAGWFAGKVSVENSAKTRIAVSLEWDLNSAKFNTNLARRCHIPEGSEKIPSSTLTKLLKSF